MAKRRTTRDPLELAKEQLERVQASLDPPDWSDLAMYGFYCLENAVTAAARRVGITIGRDHRSRVDAANRLAEEHGLPDVGSLLRDLNDARKAAAYGDVISPDLDPEAVASAVEEYVAAVEGLLARGPAD